MHRNLDASWCAITPLWRGGHGLHPIARGCMACAATIRFRFGRATMVAARPAPAHVPAKWEPDRRSGHAQNQMG
jgi:hypothetical protein